MSNNRKPIVSVILPNYNHGRFLEKRVNSILNQTFQDFELIILDDASSDTSLEILNNYKDHPKVSHFEINSKNSGSTFVQWAKGFNVAKGKYIWLAESDDFATSDFLELTVQAMELNSEVSLVYCDSIIIDEYNNIQNRASEHKNKFFKTQKWSYDYYINGREEIINFLLIRTTIGNASAVLLRKDTLNNSEYLLRLGRYKNVGDLYTYSFVILYGSVKYLQSPLNYMRDHSLNTTKLNHKNGTIYLERVLFYLDIIDQIFKITPLPNEVLKLQDVALAIVKRNFVNLVYFGYLKELKVLLSKFRYYQLIGWYKQQLILLLLNLYNLDFYKLRGFSRRAIKYICSK